jgi:hypothetical protein
MNTVIDRCHKGIDNVLKLISSTTTSVADIREEAHRKHLSFDYDTRRFRDGDARVIMPYI